MRSEIDQREYKGKIKTAYRVAQISVLVMLIDLLSFGNIMNFNLGFFGTIGLIGVFVGLVLHQYARYQMGYIEKLHYWLIFDFVLLLAAFFIWLYLL